MTKLSVRKKHAQALIIAGERRQQEMNIHGLANTTTGIKQSAMIL